MHSCREKNAARGGDGEIRVPVRLLPPAAIDKFMTSSRDLFRLPLAWAAIAVLSGLTAGCSRILPSRHGTVQSAELILDTHRDPSAALSGRFIPGVVPGVTKIPVFFDQIIPDDAVFLEASCETTQQTGAPLAVLSADIERNQVFLSFASANPTAVSELHVVVHAKYRYGW